MDPSTKTCQNCNAQFTIEPAEFAFYERVRVPSPTFCPTCRVIRRGAWREYHTLYKTTCALCKQPTLSIYPADTPFTVYCRSCYKSDKWDSLAYGREYDFTKPFFAQFRELMLVVPRPALTGHDLVNSEYTHACVGAKNSYYCFWCYYAENCQYSYGLLMSRDTYDSYGTDNSDHVYEAVTSNRLYRTSFAYFGDECLDSAMLFNCVSCTDCFGCVNLRKKKFYIFNKQVSKDEYAKQMAYWDLGSYSRLQEAQEKFRALYLSLPQRYAQIVSSVDVSGDVIRDTKNCKVCFSCTDGVEDCGFIYGGGLNLKDSYDVNYGGDISELLYETNAVTRSHSLMFSSGCNGSRNVQYSEWAHNSNYVFGCISLNHKQYCILNQQYSKEEYEELVPKIIEHMKTMAYVDKKGRRYGYGEFFPQELSSFGYNESTSFMWFPKTKEQVREQGWLWQESPARDYKITVAADKLPDHIKETPDSITDEIIGCLHNGECNEECATAFRITPQELAFHRDLNVALPRLCPNCRHLQRLKWRNGYKLWKRHCMCEGEFSTATDTNSQYKNTAKHFHDTESCPNEFEAAWDPAKPEIIYCEECYKAEFV